MDIIKDNSFVKLVKLKHSEDTKYPLIEEGFSISGFILRSPEVGLTFTILDEDGNLIFRSSPVIEILSEDSLRTNNSIYQIVDVAGRRSNRIEEILH